MQQGNRMNLEKDCIILFDSQEEIPFQREIYETTTNQYVTFPLSVDKVDLVRLISKNQKYLLQIKINQMKRVIDIAKNNEQNLQQTLKINNIQKIEDCLPDVVFGPKSLLPNKGEAGFQRLCNQDQINLNTEIQNPGSNVSVLIYKGENFQDLQNQMEQYRNDDIKINPIVLINGKSAFKKLMRSNMNTFLDLYERKYVPFHKKFSTSNHHCFYFQIQNTTGYYFFFVLARELDKLDLIKWIYQGILKFIQPKFAVIASSNENFEENINILQLFSILENQGDKYFGITCLKKFYYEGKSQYDFQGDFAEIALKIDSMFKIKQFHDPLSCIYKWSKIQDEIENYINKLQTEYYKNAWALGYNSILPKIMYQNNHLELKIITKRIVEQKFEKNQFEILFNQFCEYKQNINYQLRKCKFGQFRNVFQWFISKVQVFYNYFGISICFFFSFQCPYSVIYNLLEESVGYTAIAVILPLFYALNVLLFLLLVQLYHFNDKIIEKDKNQKVLIQAQKNEDEQKFVFQICQSDKVDVLLSQEQTDQDLIICEVQEDDYVKDSRCKIKKEQFQQQEFFLLYSFPLLKYISHIIIYLIQTQCYLDLGVVISILSNLIIIHGWIKFNNQKASQELILLIMAIFVILFHLINKKIRIYKMVRYFSMITYFWQFLQLPKKITSATQRSEQKRKLGSQLFLNFILFYSFIAIESYYNYSGYILLGVFGYLSIIYFIIDFYLLIQTFFYNQSLPKLPQQGRQYIWQVMEEPEYKLELQNNQDSNDDFVNNFRKLVAETNEGKQNQQQLQVTQYINTQTQQNLKNSVVFNKKIQNLIENNNLNEQDINKITNIIEEQINQQINIKKKEEEFQKNEQNKQKQKIQSQIQSEIKITSSFVKQGSFLQSKQQLNSNIIENE
ncbi:unnamed protein product [Paramecium sonneborni]|uniref:Transmembrane protein n=1 Tax=Paramecium sonneborni TaxID=65129 RepID=A0A8S1Q2T3_9CILI|nr:unnamed protein product [Paramecium sonneborni]